MPFFSGGGGGAAFNGGTITNPLVVNGSGTGNQLEVTAAHVDFVVDGGGTLTMGSDTSAAVVVAGTVAGGEIDVGTSSGTFGASIVGDGTSGRFTATDGTSLKAALDSLLGVVVGVTSAPPDLNLNAGSCAIWFDQTNGASKLKIKGKSADGTVVTGSVNLA